MKKRALNKLVKLLDLEILEENLFRGQSENIGGPRVFGGQVIGQALTAAARTCLLYTSPSPRDQRGSRMPSSA